MYPLEILATLFEILDHVPLSREQYGLPTLRFTRKSIRVRVKLLTDVKASVAGSDTIRHGASRSEEEASVSSPTSRME